MSEHRMVFLGGLHRSGTSLVFQCLREHPQVSGFRDTGVPEDEGQHLQSVYRPAARFGGAGRFGFASAGHLTEQSPLVTAKNRRKLWSEWAPYWDLARPVLMEKTPANLTKSRFLQALFPHASFVMLMRHPVAVAYATQKWRHTSLYSLIEHWLRCHELFEQDRAGLERLWVLRYEDFVADPDGCLRRIYDGLGLRHQPSKLEVRRDLNARYFQRWEAAQSRFWGRRYLGRLTARFEDRLRSFGYSLQRLGEAPDTTNPVLPIAVERDLLGGVSCGVHRGAGWLHHLAFASYKALRRRARKRLGVPRKVQQSAVR